MKKIIAYLLVFSMLFSCFTVSTFAADSVLDYLSPAHVFNKYISGVLDDGANYLTGLISSGDAEYVDSNTFMGLSVPAYGSDFTIVSRYQPDDSDYLNDGYYINVPAEFSGVARECIVDNTGFWHFTDFYSNTVYDCVSLYLDGTVATFVCFYSSFDAYDILVYDYSTYAAYTKIINLLSGIAENMGVVEGGSGGSIDIDTSEMEDLLGDINSSLSQVLPYLSALNQNVIDTENYAKAISEALGGVAVDVADIESELISIGSQLSSISSKFDGLQDSLDELAADNEEIKGYIDDIEFYIATVGDRISYLLDYLMQINANIISTNSILSNIKDKIDSVHLSLIDKLNELISAVKGIGSVSGGNSTGSGGGSFVADLLGGIFGVAFEALKLLLNLVFNLLSSVFGLISRFSEFISAFWGDFIPADILAVLFIIPPLSFILGVVKFLRG